MVSTFVKPFICPCVVGLVDGCYLVTARVQLCWLSELFTVVTLLLPVYSVLVDRTVHSCYLVTARVQLCSWTDWSTVVTVLLPGCSCVRGLNRPLESFAKPRMRTQCLRPRQVNNRDSQLSDNGSGWHEPGKNQTMEHWRFETLSQCAKKEYWGFFWRTCGKVSHF
jgi:hypothetical protein